MNVIEWYDPCEEAEFEGQSLRAEMDNERSVVNRVEKEKTEKAEENKNQNIQIASIQAPDEQQEKDARERQKERLCPARINSLIIEAGIIHDQHCVS